MNRPTAVAALLTLLRRRLVAARPARRQGARPRSGDRTQVVPGRRRVRGQPLRGRPAPRQADPDELRPAGPALGRHAAKSTRRSSRARSQRQDHHPRRHQGRRQGRQGHRLRRRPAHPHRHRAGRRRRLCRQQHRTASPSDTKGTGKADKRRVVLSGFGTEDTHHIIHTFRWGPDGNAVLQPVDLHSLPHRNAARRAPPERGRRLAVPAGDDATRTSSAAASATRGATPSTAGASRSSPTAPYGEGINYGLPGAYYVFASRVAAAAATASIPAARSTAGWKSSAAGTCPTTGRATASPTTSAATASAASSSARTAPAYASREKPELIKTQPPRLPPDGREDGAGRRDLHRRLVQPDHPARRGRFPRSAPRHDARPHLARDRQGPPARRAAEARRRQGGRPARSTQSAGGLDAAAGQARAEGTRREGGAAGAGEVGRRARPDGRRTTSISCSKALWTYQSLDTVEPKLLGQLLQAKDQPRRAAAVRVVGRLARPARPTRSNCSPRGSATIIRACAWKRCVRWATVGTPRSVEIAMQVLDKPVDRFLDYALWLTAHETEAAWLPALKEGKVTFGGHVRQLIFALLSADSRNAVVPLVDLARRGKVPADREESVLTRRRRTRGADGIDARSRSAFLRPDKTPRAAGRACLTRWLRRRGSATCDPAGDLARVGSAPRQRIRVGAGRRRPRCAAVGRAKRPDRNCWSSPVGREDGGRTATGGIRRAGPTRRQGRAAKPFRR